MFRRNKIGAIADLCGTLVMTGQKVEECPFATTEIRVGKRYLEIKVYNL